MGKRILFINPSKFKMHRGTQPHYGLGTLAAVLKSAGHTVRILDYAGFGGLPKVMDYIQSYQADTIGIICYSTVWTEVDKLVQDIKAQFDIPVILGGPHIACYQEDMRKYKGCECVVWGEAEDVIVDVMENTTYNQETVFIEKPNPEPDVVKLPPLDMESFVGYEDIDRYLLQTSRGCPYGCSFCAVEVVNTHKYRPRDIDVCLDEIEHISNTYPKVKEFYMIDDLFTLNMPRCKRFLNAYIERNFTQRLIISSVRADNVNEEFVDLCLRAKTMYVGVGMESMNETVFDFVDKKESLSKIKEGVALFNRKGLPWSAFMIVGLPKDNPAAVDDSIKYIKETRPNLIIWSNMTPFKSTPARAWFDKHGTILSEEGYNSAEDDIVAEIACETPDFTREQRKKAFLKARIATCSYDWRHPWVVIRRLPLIIREGLLWDLITGLQYGFGIRVRRVKYKWSINRKLNKLGAMSHVPIQAPSEPDYEMSVSTTNQ